MSHLLLLGLLLLGLFPFSTPTTVPVPLLIQLLRTKTGSGGALEGVSCQSWRLGVETNNLRNWKTIPAECEGYVGHYMLGHLYRKDCRVVVDAAIEYAKSLSLGNDGKDVWIFDIDETTLSNLPYYAHHGFGVELYDPKAFSAWVAMGKAPALPESLRLFKTLQAMGIKPVFLTGRTENQRNITTENLKMAGYKGYDRLLLKSPDFHGSAVTYKSGERKKLTEQNGFRIVGNIGDQWSDILGYPEGGRTFKLPDPMYYIG